ncbi:uncharacterized protein MYCFIDRAFT_200805 [Pseudocercospora fijiensis CIRAD86]|uniref:Uncharacterized protein n=1 Tax=Pseudocercospora fijiensis (strain CIRAD86) TaxID=383855 RepID=M2ZD29_PSEFD|nr:uncharacterized protein MYCFIDRAFT_200805 [Pseudocercospora fijiensis CIRAD86]EME77024.1 hypothetical protein MYCFIDRAFT_200805 [Pseudocercospora fijiensis CIRAD86]
MPCDYKASRPALANFAHTMTTYINHLSPKDFNQLYDLLAWTPPLPHTPAEEERNKRNLLSWIMRNYPELRHPTEKMPTTALLHGSMRLRTTSPAHMPQAIDRSDTTQSAAGNSYGIRPPDHHSSSASLPPSSRASGTPRPHRGVKSDSLDVLMSEGHQSPMTAFSRENDPAVRAASAPPSPPKHRSCRLRNPLFVQDEDTSDDELSSPSHVMKKKSGMQPRLYGASRTTSAHTSTRAPFIPIDTDDDDANFSDRKSGMIVIGTDADFLPSRLDMAENLRAPPPKQNPQQQRLGFQDLHAHHQEAIDPRIKSSPITAASTRHHTLPNHHRYQQPSNTNTPPPPPTPTADAPSPLHSQPQDPTPTSQPNPKSTAMLSALTSALDTAWSQLREHCHAGNLADAVNTLATMTSLVVLVRDGGFEVEGEDQEEGVAL